MTKNKRSFRIVDSRDIHKTLELTVQFQNKIEEACLQYGVNPSDMPNSVLPTNILYEIVASHNIMYDKLLAEELIYSANNHKINKQPH